MIGKVCIRAKSPITGPYPGFCSMKRLGVFLLPPGWDASLSQGYPPVSSLPVPIQLNTWAERRTVRIGLPKNTAKCPWSGLEPRPLHPEPSALTMKSPSLHLHQFKLLLFQSLTHNHDWAQPWCMMYDDKNSHARYSKIVFTVNHRGITRINARLNKRGKAVWLISLLREIVCNPVKKILGSTCNTTNSKRTITVEQHCLTARRWGKRWRRPWRGSCKWIINNSATVITRTVITNLLKVVGGLVNIEMKIAIVVGDDCMHTALSVLADSSSLACIHTTTVIPPPPNPRDANSIEGWIHTPWLHWEQHN